MSAEVHFVAESIKQAESEQPIVIVGTGPVGIKALITLLEKNPQENIVIYGDEPWEPYNRVKLSSFLAGDAKWDDLTESQKLPALENLIHQFNCKIVAIDRNNKTVIDENGNQQQYRKLILAMGSQPHVPSIEGTHYEGVYTFRNMTDAQKLMARQVRSRTVVIVGGGVLGLEAAKAMMRNHTTVIVIDHSMHLMPNQLDEEAAELLREHVISLGINLYLGSGIKRVIGDLAVTGVELRNGRIIECDTVIFSTGIRSNIELAREAHISVGRGIKVSDTMQTSDADIYAIGECAQHRDVVYGLVAPGFEQAKVAVAHIYNNKKANYKGSITATQLKVVGIPVFSMGRTGAGESRQIFIEHVYNRPEKGIYRKIIIFRNRLVGAISVGSWDSLNRLQESICKERYMWPWLLKRYLKTGDLWSEEKAKNVSQWPAQAVVCNCMGVTRGQCSKAIEAGCNSINEIMQSTSASTVCGGCRPLIAELLGGIVKAEKLRAIKTFLAISLLATFAILSAFTLPGLSYNPSSEADFQWDILWRENIYKQISGFSILGLVVFSLLVSVRKRWKRFSFFDYSFWRYMHVVLGLMIVMGLFLHTGFRGGENLNMWLMTIFSTLVLTGGIYGMFMSIQHKFDGVLAQRIRSQLNWVHLLLFWPLPVLLVFHVLKTYYF